MLKITCQNKNALFFVHLPVMDINPFKYKTLDCHAKLHILKIKS